MKTFNKNLGVLTVLVLASLSSVALADTYDLTFTAATLDNTLASGQINVTDGLAVSGSLDITAGPDIGDYILVPGNAGDSAFTYDSIVTPGSDNGFLDSTGGLLWSLSGVQGNSEEINMWYNSTSQYGPTGTYALWGANSGGYDLEAYGGATIISAPIAPPPSPLSSVPDSGWTASLLGGTMVGLQALRRKVA